jgi:hypothetical protein
MVCASSAHCYGCYRCYYGVVTITTIVKGIDSIVNSINTLVTTINAISIERAVSIICKSSPLDASAGAARFSGGDEAATI